MPAVKNIVAGVLLIGLSLSCGSSTAPAALEERCASVKIRSSSLITAERARDVLVEVHEILVEMSKFGEISDLPDWEQEVKVAQDVVSRYDEHEIDHVTEAVAVAEMVTRDALFEVEASRTISRPELFIQVQSAAEQIGIPSCAGAACSVAWHTCIEL